MKDLPIISGPIDSDNWQEQINRLACQSAQDALVDLGPEASITLAFALLQTYFMLTYSRSLPFLEHDGRLDARIDTLRKVMASTGLEFETTIATQEINHQ